MSRPSPSLPAVLGGSPAVTIDHAASNRWPCLNADDEAAVLAVMRDGDITTHPVIRELEADYAALTGRKYALAHCNGSAALLAAFFGLGLQPGDEVLVPSATFWASVLPMLWVGAVPVFCESEPERMGICPADMARKVTDRTRAIVVVHLWGLPSKMTEIRAFAAEHNLKIIEDAAHAHGAIWRGTPCGALGDISVFSLQGDKLAPAGEGGVLLTDDADCWQRATCLGDITRIIELESVARRFAGTSFGIKTRIAPVSAAIARSQLRQLRDRNAQRNQNLERLSVALEALGFTTFQAPEHIERVYFEYLIRVDPDRVPLPIPVLLDALNREGCVVGAPRYPLLHQQPFFTEGHFKDVLRLPDQQLPDYASQTLLTTEMLNQQMLKLPSFPGPDDGIIDQYIEAFQRVIGHADQILAIS